MPVVGDNRPALRSPGISNRSVAPHLLDLRLAGLGNHGFDCVLPAHPPPNAFYRVSVRQVVAVAPASFRPLLMETPLPSLSGGGSLPRRGLAPPRTGTCPAYKQTGRLPLRKSGLVKKTGKLFAQVSILADNPGRPARLLKFSHSRSANSASPIMGQ